MNMKRYLTLIKHLQAVVLGISIVLLATMPSAIVLVPSWFHERTYGWLYAAAHISLFFVMSIRPLADIFREMSWVRPLVILRKSFGVFSASIIVSFLLAKIMVDPSGYLAYMLSGEYWSLADWAVLAHVADLSAVLLLITSNNLSKQILGSNWKRLQKLSYVYFYGSALYVYLVFGETISLWYLIVVTAITVLAWMRNRAVVRRVHIARPA